MKNTFLTALISLGIFGCQTIDAQCVTAGTYSGPGSNNTGTGSIAWSNPTYADGTTPDGQYATTGSLLTAFSSANSNYLIINQLGFNINSTDIICGIVVTINHLATGLVFGSIVDNDIRMLNGGVAATGTGANHAQGGAWPGTMTATTYGGVNDMWGSTWTPAQINNPSFGIQISVNMTSLLGIAFNGNIDNVTVTVYSEPTILALSELQLSVKETPTANQLTWTSSVSDNTNADNTNADKTKIIIDRSADGDTWTTIDSTVTPTYSYEDKTPLKGENFYRLHLSDAYGLDKYSTIVNVDRPEGTSLICFPNPFSDDFVIQSAIPFNTVVIRTITGNIVKQYSNCGSTTLRVPTVSLKPGIYVVAIDDKVTKMIKQ